MLRPLYAGCTAARFVYSLIFCWLISFPVWAHEQEDMRGIIGIKLFPALLAADLNLSSRVDENGEITVVLVYAEDNKVAVNMASRLESNGDIKGFKLHVLVMPWKNLKDKGDVVAGVFIAEPMSDVVPDLIQYCNTRNVLLFSPYSGDVERGVLAGLEVTDRIRPYLNMDAMRDADVRLKPFFVELASQYDQE